MNGMCLNAITVITEIGKSPLGFVSAKQQDWRILIVRDEQKDMRLNS